MAKSYGYQNRPTLHYEWFFSGEPLFARSRFYNSPEVAAYKAMAERLLTS